MNIIASLRITLKTIAFSLAAMGLGQLALAQTFNDGLSAYDDGNPSKAFEIWLNAAQSGDARAQYRLARLYSRGEGATRDRDEAERWYRQAANQGLADAQFNLGMFLHNDSREEEGNEFLARASAQGHARAREELTDMLSNSLNWRAPSSHPLGWADSVLREFDAECDAGRALLGQAGATVPQAMATKCLKIQQALPQKAYGNASKCLQIEFETPSRSRTTIGISNTCQWPVSVAALALSGNGGRALISDTLQARSKLFSEQSGSGWDVKWNACFQPDDFISIIEDNRGACRRR